MSRHQFTLRSRLRRMLEAMASCAGFRLMRKAAAPFGIDWHRDILHFPEGRSIHTAIDIGANVGQTARILVAAFPRADVHCFEPVSVTYEQLCASVGSLPRVRCHRIALCNRIGELKISAMPLSGSNRLLSDDDVAASSDPFEAVPATTLDAFCAEQGIQRVDLLKMDVEGAELRVLEGARQTLHERSVPFVLSECDFFSRGYEPHARFSDLYDFLAPFGYQVVSFYTGGVDEHGWRWGNVLFRRVAHDDAGKVCVSPEQAR